MFINILPDVALSASGLSCVCVLSFPPLPGLLGPALFRCGLGSLVSLSWEGGIDHSLQLSVQPMHTHSHESSLFLSWDSTH